MQHWGNYILIWVTPTPERIDTVKIKLTVVVAETLLVKLALLILIKMVDIKFWFKERFSGLKPLG